MLGGTLDDALGEAFDKAARLVGLSSTGSPGAAVEALAAKGTIQAGLLTVPMKDRVDCDFSYAGLKNQFRMAVESSRTEHGLDSSSTNAPPSTVPIALSPASPLLSCLSLATLQLEATVDTVSLPETAAADLCASFQHAAFTHVEDRIRRAMDYVERNNLNVTTLVVVGGVAANKELRRCLMIPPLH